MSITLPSELTWALSLLGMDFPDSDEDKLNELGQAWNAFAGTLKGLIGDAEKHAQAVWTDNNGEPITAFKDKWSGPEAPLANLRDGADVAAGIAASFSIAAKAVVVLKMAFIAEVASFARTCIWAARIAKTPWTAAAAVAMVVAARIAATMAINAAIEECVKVLTNE